MKSEETNNDRTLFLDRDGVINERIVDGYVTSWDEFRFLPGVMEAIAVLSDYFNRIVVVTNQQGVGRGLMSSSALEDIHDRMVAEIISHNGRIDAVFACTDTADKPRSCRKPGVAMGLWARKRFPEIRFRRAVMVGDMDSDMRFAGNLGMKRVFVDGGDPEAFAGEHGCDLRVESLQTFAECLDFIKKV